VVEEDETEFEKSI